MQVSKLSVDSGGRVHGTCPSGQPVQQNSPSWPCPNGSSGGMSVPSGVMGVLMHTMVGDLPGTIQVFNEASFQASAHFGVDQAGNIHQFGPVNGWRAWHCAAGNSHWYGIEFADHGNPANPLTQAQIGAGAQLLEVLSRPAVGNFPMQITNSTGIEGFGVHRMGGLPFGGHSCPQLGNGSGPRSGQREDIIKLAQAIRSGNTPPAARTWTVQGMLTLAELAAQDLREPVATVLAKTLQNSPGHVFAANLASHIRAVFAGDFTVCPNRITWYYPGVSSVQAWVTRGQLSLSALAAHLDTDPATMIALTVQRGGQLATASAGYINAVFAASPIHVPAGCVVFY